MNRVVVAVCAWFIMGVAGCGGAVPVASTPSAPPVDPNVAFTQYDKAALLVECSDAYGDMGDAHHDGKLDAMKDRAREYRDAVATWEGELTRIAFPDTAQPIVDELRRLLARELAGLNELVEIDVNDVERIRIVRSEVEAADAEVILENDRLRESLGHSEGVFGYAADRLAVAESTFTKELLPINVKFEAALANNDLAAAKAANELDIDALQRYIDNLDDIDWPPGSFEGQANTLKDHLRGLIEFDRRQTDVATAAQIVRAPEGGTPDWIGARDTYDALWNGLVQAYQATNPESKC